MIKVGLKTKIRFYTFTALMFATVLTFVYLSYIEIDDRTPMDDIYAKNAELIIMHLQGTEWGRSSRGHKILSAFRAEELRIVSPQHFIIKGQKHYSYRMDGPVQSAASGLMTKEQGRFTIYIGVYHISELENATGRIIRYMDYGIPEDEFIHILIDELLSRHQEGKYFVNGEASLQEELDAWLAAEEAVKAYYSDPNYIVEGLSYQRPNYGPDAPKYIEVQ